MKQGTACAFAQTVPVLFLHMFFICDRSLAKIEVMIFVMIIPVRDNITVPYSIQGLYGTVINEFRPLSWRAPSGL